MQKLRTLIAPHLGALWCVLLAVVFVLLCCALTGCASGGGPRLTPEQANELLTAAEEESAELDTVIAQTEAQLAALPQGETRDKVLAELARAKATKAAVDAAIADINAATAGAETWLDFAAAGLTATSKSVPPPYGVIAGLGGILLGFIAEARKRRTEAAAASVIEAIEHAKKDNSGVVNFGDPQTKAQLRASMSTPARKFVESKRKA
jgi:hypothetical protein